MNKRGKLVVLSAPSGCGKSTIVRALMEKRDDIRFSVSATTRAPRQGERNGVDYYFIDHDKFNAMVDNGEFLEHATYVNNQYGTPRAPVDAQMDQGYNVILDIDVQGAMQVKKIAPEAMSIFIMPPSIQELENRLRFRGTNSEEDIFNRLKIAEKEFSFKDEYDYVVINDSVDRAVAEISAIIDK